MGFGDASGKEKIVILFNAVVRFAQLIVAAAALGVYAAQKGYWLDHDLPGRIVSTFMLGTTRINVANTAQTFELVVGALSLITALAFAVIPFFLSYRPVALGAPWDLILMIFWAAAFGLMKAIFLKDYTNQDTLFEVNDPKPVDEHKFRDNWNTMMQAAYINLAGLILFLISGLMGLVLFFLGRRTGKTSGKAQYV